MDWFGLDWVTLELFHKVVEVHRFLGCFGGCCNFNLAARKTVVGCFLLAHEMVHLFIWKVYLDVL